MLRPGFFDVQVVALDDALHIVTVTLRHIAGIDGDIGRNFLFEIDRGLHHRSREASSDSPRR